MNTSPGFKASSSSSSRDDATSHHQPPPITMEVSNYSDQIPINVSTMMMLPDEPFLTTDLTTSVTTLDKPQSSIHLNQRKDNNYHGLGSFKDDGDNPDGNNSKAKNKRRSKVHHACVYCQRSHMTCDKARPCQRCVRRRIGHLCHDVPPPSIEDGAKAISPSIFIEAHHKHPTTYDNIHPPTTTIPFSYSSPLPTLSSRPLPISPLLFPKSAPRLPKNEDQIINQNITSFKSQPVDVQRAYHHLAQFCSKYYSLEGQARIFHSIALTKDDSMDSIQRHGSAIPAIENEELIYHCLLEYDRLFLAISTPMIIIRRSGDILRVNTSFTSLINIPASKLIEYWHFYELLTEEAYVNFAERIAEIILQPSVGSILMATTLVVGGWRNLIANACGDIAANGSSSKLSSPPTHSSATFLSPVENAIVTGSSSTSNISDPFNYQDRFSIMKPSRVSNESTRNNCSGASSLARLIRGNEGCGNDDGDDREGISQLINCSMAVTVRRHPNNYPDLIVITVIPSSYQ